MLGRNAKGRSARSSGSEAAARLEERIEAAPTTLLAIVGQQSRVEGKFEVADAIEIEREIGGGVTVAGWPIETDSLVISQGGFFNGTVAKIREQDAHAGPRPGRLVEDKRLGARK